VLPLEVIEASHFLGSIAGAALLLLSQGLARRLDGAWLLTVAVVATGIVASLLKGADYEEAQSSPSCSSCSGALDRHSIGGRRFSTRGSPADGSSRLSAHWRVDLAGTVRVQACRLFERAVVAVRAARRSIQIPPCDGGGDGRVLLFAVSRVAAPARHEAEEPNDADLDAAGRLCQRRRTPRLFSCIFATRRSCSTIAARIRDVRRRRAYVGCARRSVGPPEVARH
jgi:phosphatidylglycerol lysyltransferase